MTMTTTTDDVALIVTGPHGFSGAQQIMSGIIYELSREGLCVHYIGFERPFRFRTNDADQIAFHTVKDISSGAIGDLKPIKSSDVLAVFTIAEQMTDLAIKLHSTGSRLILWGVYMFPYGHAAWLSKRTLTEMGLPADLWLTPAGSDMWEIGPQVRNTTKGILGSSEVSVLITYTRQFADEITTMYELNRPFVTAYPILDFSRFHAASAAERAQARKVLQVRESELLISSHSNMRPVKMPEAVIDIAAAVAERTDRQITLAMVGPKIAFPTRKRSRNFRLIQTGVVDRVEEVLRAADVELNCSFHDSFNLSLAEAMACGVPCVSTDVVGIGQEILASECGLLFSCVRSSDGKNRCSFDFESAVNCVLTLVNSERLRRRMSKNASAHARRVFHRDSVISSYCEIIHNTEAREEC
ncbi:MAG: glycosyltransferase [Armatimonadota bacterium]|nr:glycosyltransferase [bacterium]